MKKLKSLASMATIVASITMSMVASAQEPDLGFDLVGWDLTDPEDDGDPEADSGYNAVFSSSEEPGFGGGEFAFNVFDNAIGGGNAKWCCGNNSNFPTDPLWVQAAFDLPIILTSFTITSGNDAPERDALAWEIQGSNDGVEFVTIFRQEDDFPIWDTVNQVALFESGDDYPLPPAYTTIRLLVESTGGGNVFQLGELEFFGNIADIEEARFLRISVDSVNSISLSLIDGEATSVNADSLVLKIDDATVTPVIAKDGDITTVTYTPPTPWAEGSEHTYALRRRKTINYRI
jgi:hypothetical protein